MLAVTLSLVHTPSTIPCSIETLCEVPAFQTNHALHRDGKDKESTQICSLPIMIIVHWKSHLCLHVIDPCQKVKPRRFTDCLPSTVWNPKYFLISI